MSGGAVVFTAAVWQGQATPGDIKENLNMITRIMEKAQHQGADILVFPELVLTGYDIGPDKLRNLARPQGCAELQCISERAAALELAVCVPYVEGEGDHGVFNSAALFDCEGRLVYSYRKTHLWSDYEKDVFTPGSALAVHDIKLRGGRSMKMGVLICFDIEFCEPARVLGLLGAQAILVPTALGAGPADHVTPMQSVPARAAENAAVVLYSNLWGCNNKMEFCGCSGIMAPDGSELVRAGRRGDALLVSTIVMSDYDDYKKRNPYLTERRPELYSVITDRK